MLVNICKLNKSSELKAIEIGQRLTGLRIYLMVIETGREAFMLSTEEGQVWLKEQAHRFVSREA